MSLSGVEKRELAALPGILASRSRTAGDLRGEPTCILSLRFYFLFRRTKITIRMMQRVTKPAKEIPIIIIGFLYQLFVGADTGISSVFAPVDTFAVLSAGEGYKTLLL